VTFIHKTYTLAEFFSADCGQKNSSANTANAASARIATFSLFDSNSGRRSRCDMYSLRRFSADTVRWQRPTGQLVRSVWKYVRTQSHCLVFTASASSVLNNTTGITVQEMKYHVPCAGRNFLFHWMELEAFNTISLCNILWTP